MSNGFEFKNKDLLGCFRGGSIRNLTLPLPVPGGGCVRVGKKPITKIQKPTKG